MVGDINGNIAKLRSQMRHMRFPLQLDMDGLAEGKPAVLLPILHFALLSFSEPFARFLSNRGFELRAKSDLRFLEGAYRFFREHRSYAPALSVSQFFAAGFAERKVMLCQDILRLVLETHQELTAGKRSVRRGKVDADAPSCDGAGPRGPDGVSTLDELAAQTQPAPTPCPAPCESPKVPLSDAHCPGGAGLDPEVVVASVTSNGNNVVFEGSADLELELEELRQLMDRICGSLTERMDRLEESLEQGLESARQDTDARLSLLEGEVKILTTRIQDGFARSATPLAFDFREKCQVDSVRGDVSCLPSITPITEDPMPDPMQNGTQGLGRGPLIQRLTDHPLDTAICGLVTLPTDSRSVASAVNSDIAAEQLLRSIGQRRIPDFAPESGSSSSAGLDASVVPTVSCRTPLQRVRTAERAVDTEAEALLQRLASRFQGTQQLLDKAQQRAQQACAQRKPDGSWNGLTSDSQTYKSEFVSALGPGAPGAS